MIPKILHLCWISGDDYPPLINQCLATWRDVLPDYKIIIWDADRIRSINSTWVSEAVDAKLYAFAADYVRLHALYYFGGIYLDSDVEVLKSFDPLLDNSSFIGLETSLDIEAAVIGAAPGLCWIKSCMDYYVGRSFSLGGKAYDTKPLPIIIRDVLNKTFSINFDRIETPVVLSEISLTVFSPHYFSPKNRYTGQISATQDTYCIHHLDGKWVKPGFKVKLVFHIHFLLSRILGAVLHKRIVNFYRTYFK